MALQILTFFILLFGCVCSAPVNEVAVASEKGVVLKDVEDKEDLRTAASGSVARRYADWNSYASSPTYGNYGYGVTGYGTQDSRYNYYGNGYDNTYTSGGYGGGYGSRGYAGYGSTGYDGYNQGGYGLSGYGGGSSGGYGGWGGNGGLTSYYGYNSPGYQGNYNLGYGYYNNRKPGPGYGNIYNSGITPSLVTGYRGYSRR
ncbi:hypothetical protein O0L34_g16363 [Tuta absoluta]|nr:hypothetical protein O0L34_g16363 [Tuta absoluta]